jgi:hypothetical protein
MPHYTEYAAVILALIELRAQVADDVTHTHLSAALRRLHSLRDDALLRAAAPKPGDLNAQLLLAARPKATSPESILPTSGYGFRARRFPAPRTPEG